ncbi:MAG: formate dehydrogenase accessory sulfurtransferase FdhD [Phycisphaera sp.]|nr:formate dehydrogenase accessory sulfurtransferase FdhD [Phycisphaera sp.]
MILHDPNRVPIVRYQRGQPAQPDNDELAMEEPLEIRVRGRAVSVTMRTPGQGERTDGEDAELAAGFLVTENIVRSRDDIARIDPCVRAPDGNIVNVFLSAGVEVDFDRLTRHVFASSSCGLCGKASIEAVLAHCPALNLNESQAQPIDPDMVLGLPDKLRNAQAAFERTGGLHAAGVFDRTGRLVVVREDVGRHNAVDKVVGHALLHGPWPLRESILQVSGRASFEIVQKALAARIPIVSAVSAPSSLAVEFARDSGITLVGFVRGERMNVYTHPERIAGM